MRKQSATQRSKNPKGKRSLLKSNDHFNRPVISVKDTNKLVHNVNMRLQRLVRAINDQLELPHFGDSLFCDNGDSCVFNDTHTLVAATIADRITSKFESPDYSTEKLLRAQCTADWVSFEQTHVKRYNFCNLAHGVEGRGIVYRGRELINSWLFDTRKKVNYWSSLEDAPIDFGPGESYEPNQGDTSVFSKINPNMIFPNWTVTIDYAVHAAFLIAANKGLRTMAREFLRKPRYPSARDLSATSDLRDIWDSTPKPRVSKRIWFFAERVFKEIFAAYPLHHKDCLIKMGSRGSSVYKNKKKRRFIEIQCLINVVGQKLGGHSVRACLKANAKVDLDDGQQYHRWLISQSTVSTLDESNASDSIVLSTALEFVGPKSPLGRLIGLTRAQFIRLKTTSPTPNGRLHESVNWHPIEKLSSMGNGFTFEILSLVLASICRQFDKKSSVYGDDIICDTDKASQIVSAIRTVGFVVNTKKSFIGKPLRESCGAFYLDGFGYITCFDIKWCSNLIDVVKVCNKLRRILNNNDGWKHPLRDLIEEAYADILCLTPVIFRGPVRIGNDLPDWIEDTNFLRAHKRSDFARSKIAPHWGLLNDLTQRWQLVRPGSYPFAYSNEWALCYIPQVQPVVRVSRRYAGLQVDSPLMWSYIHSGRVVDMQMRSNKDEQKVGLKPTFVHSCGVFLRAGTARRVCAPADKDDYKKRIIKEKIRLSKAARKRRPGGFLPK